MLPTRTGEAEKCSTSLQNTPGKKLSEASRLHKSIWKQHLPPFHPFRMVASLPRTISVQLLADRNPWQTYPLHYSPNNGQATGFRRERINLIGASSNITKKAFNRIGGANVTVHDWRKRVKGEEMVFVFTEAADCFGVALLVFGLKCRKIE